MARDAVTVTTLGLNAGTLEPAGTAISVANGASVAAGGDTRGLLIRVAATTGGDITIQSGSKPPAELASNGDLVQEVATNDERIFVVEGARFIQADGSIWIDFEAATAGTVWAYRLPQGG